LIPILVRTLRVPTLVLLILLLPILAALVLLIPGLALVLLVRTLWVAALVVLALLIPILALVALVLLTVRHGVSPIGDASATQQTRRPRTFAPKQPTSKPKFSSGTCSLHKRFRFPHDSINALAYIENTRTSYSLACSSSCAQQALREPDLTAQTLVA
jgi:ABC-type transport system involved in multi-copper enzyme maturation permease subunit